MKYEMPSPAGSPGFCSSLGGGCFLSRTGGSDLQTPSARFLAFRGDLGAAADLCFPATPRPARICKPETKLFILREAAALNCRSRGTSSPLMSAAECGCTGLGTTSKAGPPQHPPSRPRLAGRLYLPPLPIQTLGSSAP